MTISNNKPYPAYIEVTRPPITDDQIDTYLTKYFPDTYRSLKMKDIKESKSTDVYEVRSVKRKDIEESKQGEVYKVGKSSKKKYKHCSTTDVYRQARYRELINFFKLKTGYYTAQIDNLRSGRPLKQDAIVFRDTSESGLRIGTFEIFKWGITVSVKDRKFKESRKQSSAFYFERTRVVRAAYQTAKTEKRKFIKQLRHVELNSYFKRLMANLSDRIKFHRDHTPVNNKPVAFSSKVLKYDLGEICVSADERIISVGKCRINEEGVLEMDHADEFQVFDESGKLTEIGSLFISCRKLQNELDKLKKTESTNSV